MKLPRAVRPYAARELGRPLHNYLRCKLPGYGSERGIFGQGVDRVQPHIVQSSIPAKPEASGIGYCRIKDVGLLQYSDLTICSCVQQHCIELIGRAVGRDVAEVSGRETVLVRKFVINVDCFEILGDDPLSRESVCSEI